MQILEGPADCSQNNQGSRSELHEKEDMKQLEGRVQKFVGRGLWSRPQVVISAHRLAHTPWQSSRHGK